MIEELILKCEKLEKKIKKSIDKFEKQTKTTVLISVNEHKIKLGLYIDEDIIR